jgi:hypothetical protein
MEKAHANGEGWYGLVAQLDAPQNQRVNQRGDAVRMKNNTSMKCDIRLQRYSENSSPNSILAH